MVGCRGVGRLRTKRKNKGKLLSESTLISTPSNSENVCINAIAFYGCVSYYCPWSASILSASRPPSLLLTRGSRERALFAPYFSHIFPLVCFISVFLDAEVAGAAEGLGSRAPHPGSWRRTRRL